MGVVTWGRGASERGSQAARSLGHRRGSLGHKAGTGGAEVDGWKPDRTPGRDADGGEAGSGSVPRERGCCCVPVVVFLDFGRQCSGARAT